MNENKGEVIRDHTLKNKEFNSCRIENICLVRDWR